MNEPMNAGFNLPSTRAFSAEPHAVFGSSLPQIDFTRQRVQVATEPSTDVAQLPARPHQPLFPSFNLAQLEYRLLCWAFPRDPELLSGKAYSNCSKLKTLLGDDIVDRIKGKTVVDFGCGLGDQSIELAKNGAKLVIGVDIRHEALRKAREKAAHLSNVLFITPDKCPRAAADMVISLDTFEHFEDPAAALRLMNDLLVPGGAVLVSFGPPWRHPLGGHSFSTFLWSHLLFSERALCRWYNRTKNETLSRFEEISGGLNRMTVARFEKLIGASPFRHASVTPVPIRRLKRFHNLLTREFTTAVVKCQLIK